jgi:hypothetical protein
VIRAIDGRHQRCVEHGRLVARDCGEARCQRFIFVNPNSCMVRETGRPGRDWKMAQMVVTAGIDVSKGWLWPNQAELRADQNAAVTRGSPVSLAEPAMLRDGSDWQARALEPSARPTVRSPSDRPFADRPPQRRRAQRRSMGSRPAGLHGQIRSPSEGGILAGRRKE